MPRYSGTWYDHQARDSHEAKFLCSDTIEEEFEERFGHAPSEQEFDDYLELRELEYIS